MTKVRTLSQTKSLEKRGFGKKGRKGRTSVMGGKYDQDHWPNVLRGTMCSIIICLRLRTQKNTFFGSKELKIRTLKKATNHAWRVTLIGILLFYRLEWLIVHLKI